MILNVTCWPFTCQLYSEVITVKNVTLSLMEIPCHVMSQIHGSVAQIHTKFQIRWLFHIPCHLSRFYLFSLLQYDMDFGQVQVMEFPWYFLKDDGISIRFGVIFDQTAVKKLWENPCHIFHKVNLSAHFSVVFAYSVFLWKLYLELSKSKIIEVK